MSIERTTGETSEALAAELVRVSNTSTELARACYAAMREARLAFEAAAESLAARNVAERKLEESRAWSAKLVAELEALKGAATEMEELRRQLQEAARDVEALERERCSSCRKHLPDTGARTIGRIKR